MDHNEQREKGNREAKTKTSIESEDRALFPAGGLGGRPPESTPRMGSEKRCKPAALLAKNDEEERATDLGNIAQTGERPKDFITGQGGSFPTMSWCSPEGANRHRGKGRRRRPRRPAPGRPI